MSKLQFNQRSKKDNPFFPRWDDTSFGELSNESDVPNYDDHNSEECIEKDLTEVFVIDELFLGNGNFPF